MSLITRCPACGTMFKVVPDQLRISEGWVRCGHCAEVFDASANLQDETPAAVAQPPSEAEADSLQAASLQAGAQPLPQPAPQAEPEVQGDSADPTWAGGFVSSFHSQVGDSVLTDAPDSVALQAEAQVLKEHPLDRPFELRRADPSEVEEPGPHGYSLPIPLQPETGPESSPDLQDLSFVRQARRKAFWRRPLVRVTLVLACLLLGALLALQFAVHDRDRLAASEPALRPWLAALCRPLQCTLGAPRQIDAIAIDTSSFNKLRGDTYRLNVTVKNHARTQVAMPALELTLTDAQDQAVLRRVLLPTEFSPGAAAIAAGGESSTSVALAVAPNNGGSRIAGYRLLAFYP